MVRFQGPIAGISVVESKVNAAVESIKKHGDDERMLPCLYSSIFDIAGQIVAMDLYHELTAMNFMLISDESVFSGSKKDISSSDNKTLSNTYLNYGYW